ncbi:MAG: molybdate ABC transporter substrate-binding protein [Brevundimonas sp.]|uniref:molybdate ABC transporter substrate-binding protein n=1 Tax=Brevundimonas sp. TaxID=1871086 RepID=UPI0027190B30|nr:molybdate ABC transporter substrate-binding protein [Brevundimonas sp.]MDO9586670.1 molybdate ABC transporter substrate-binding protein [Brevundimonas sp.]
MLLAATALAACAPPRPGGPAPIDLFAAASLREVMDAAVADHLRRSGQTVRATYAGSAQLARQIAQGAPADLFMSADESWMDWLDQRGLIDPSARRRLAGNGLVLVAPVSSPDAPVDLTSPTGLAERLGDGRLAVAEAATPAGRYGQEALTRLNLWPGVKDRLAPGDDVRAALALVARGEAPLGLVYATDALAEPRVRVVAAFPPASHPPIAYSAAPVRRRDGAGDPVAAQAFLDLLAGADGQALFRRFGFAPPPA